MSDTYGRRLKKEMEDQDQTSLEKQPILRRHTNMYHRASAFDIRSPSRKMQEIIEQFFAGAISLYRKRPENYLPK